MGKAFTITILLPDGSPDGLRVIEKSNWNGRLIDFARADWTKVRARKDFDRPGVYVLTGAADDGGVAIYVGEAEDLRDRINNHYANIDFWTRAVAFVSKDATLNKVIVRFLEAKLLGLASTAKRAKLHNSNQPSIPHLSEAVLAEADGFLDGMLPIYPILGIHAFDVVVAPSQSVRPSSRLRVRSQVVAYGRDAAEGFIVEAGSEARTEEQASIPPQLHALREKLIADGILRSDGESLSLTQDYVFSSPSNAAGVLLGRAANGRVEWVDDSGRTLKQLQEAAVG